MGWARRAEKEAGPGRALSVSSDHQPNIHFASFCPVYDGHTVWKFCLGLRHVVLLPAAAGTPSVQPVEYQIQMGRSIRTGCGDSPRPRLACIPDPVNTHLFMVKVRLVGCLPSLTTSHVRMQPMQTCVTACSYLVFVYVRILQWRRRQSRHLHVQL